MPIESVMPAQAVDERSACVRPIPLPNWESLITDVALRGEDVDLSPAVAWVIGEQVGADELDEQLRAAAVRIFGDYAHAWQSRGLSRWRSSRSLATIPGRAASCSDPGPMVAP